MKPLTIITGFVIFIMGGILGATITLWALYSPPMSGAPKYRIQNPHHHKAPEIMARIDPCFKRTGGIDKDPCERINTIPEPPSIALMLVGIAGLVLVSKHHKEHK